MFNQLAKPFFFSTLIVALLLALLSAIPAVISDESYAGYSAWWVIVVPVLGLIAAGISAKCLSCFGVSGKISLFSMSKRDLFYQIYSYSSIPVFLIVEGTIVYYFWNHFYTLYNSFIPLLFWLIYVAATFIVACLLFLLFTLLLKKEKILSLLVGILILLAFVLTSGTVSLTSYVALLREAYRDYPKTEYYIEEDNS